MNGWIKLHQKTIYSEVWLRDPTAWRVFEFLLLKAYSGKPQGTVTTTRQQIADGCLVNNNTAWSALLRLKKAKMINSVGNNRFTTITICNWRRYQGDKQQPRQHLSNNETTTKQHSYKNIDIDKETNVRTLGSTYGNAEVNKVVSEFETLFGYRMPLVKANRNAASNLIKRYGLEKTLGAIKYAASVRDEPYQPTIADLRDLWVKMPKLAIAYTKSNNGMVIIKGNDGSN